MTALTLSLCQSPFLSSFVHFLTVVSISNKTSHHTSSMCVSRCCGAAADDLPEAVWLVYQPPTLLSLQLLLPLGGRGWGCGRAQLAPAEPRQPGSVARWRTPAFQLDILAPLLEGLPGQVRPPSLATQGLSRDNLFCSYIVISGFTADIAALPVHIIIIQLRQFLLLSVR